MHVWSLLHDQRVRWSCVCVCLCLCVQPACCRLWPCWSVPRCTRWSVCSICVKCACALTSRACPAESCRRQVSAWSDYSAEQRSVQFMSTRVRKGQKRWAGNINRPAGESLSVENDYYSIMMWHFAQPLLCKMKVSPFVKCNLFFCARGSLGPPSATDLLSNPLKSINSNQPSCLFSFSVPQRRAAVCVAPPLHRQQLPDLQPQTWLPGALRSACASF